jgi:sugar/nucleoside kinase (ribokinase family)
VALAHCYRAAEWVYKGINPLVENSSPFCGRTLGAATFATGGGMSNVGLALIRLGVSTKLVGKIGDDFFGDAILRVLESYDKNATRNLIIEKGGSSSYTLVLNPPGHDRTFLHNPGCNDTLKASDIDLETLGPAKIFYFGYPSLMKTMREDPKAFADLYKEAQARGLTTCLDMSLPDAEGESGKVDWQRFLETVLPFVDIFIPSLEEILFMLERPFYDSGKWQQAMPAAYLHEVTEKILGLGVAVAGIKLGEQGLYLRTASAKRFNPVSNAVTNVNVWVNPDVWADRELWSPIFQVDVKGTVGAGDSTIAGFLSALLKGSSPEDALNMACAVGACCVEAPDASSGVRSWEDTDQRVRAGWARGFTGVLAGWQRLENGVYQASKDSSFLHPKMP